VTETTCQHCGHPAILHAMTGLRCELCDCLGLHAPPPAARPAGYLWQRVEDRCRVCGKDLGCSVRFLAVAVCVDCAQAATPP
jgi:hypothetical protein